jgi:5-oxoprolinase (ATP-hydrolysing) subunit C
VSAVLRIVNAGPGVTLQDGGRHGLLRFGVTGAGPMDPAAHATANSAAGVAPASAALEVSLGGVELEVEGEPLVVAVVGGSFVVMADGTALAHPCVLTLEPGVRLSIRAGESGAWTYVAVGGHIDVPLVLGSVSTHTRSGLGGLDGRALTAGDALPVCSPSHLEGPPATFDAPWLEGPGDVVRVVLGPQDDYFAADQIAAFLNGPWTLTARSDRMAYVLEGPKLAHAKGFNIVSDGIPMGAIQVPGSGKPIVLMADRQPTGGYPKIATVIGADLGPLAQLRPGARFRFEAVSIEDAVAARRRLWHAVAQPLSLRPIVRTEFPSDFLLGTNLIGGIVDAGHDDV